MTPSSFPDISTANTQRRAVWWTLSAVFLALAIGAKGGQYSLLALFWLSLAIAGALVGTFHIAQTNGKRSEVAASENLPVSTKNEGEVQGQRFGWPQIGVATPDLNRVLSAACILFGTLSLQRILPASTPFRVLWLGVFVLLATLLAFGITWCGRRGLGKVFFPIFLLLQLGMGVFAIQSAHQSEQKSPRYRLQVRHDVQIFNREAARLLLAGQNPYAVRMPNVMGQDMPFYPPNTTGQDGKLPFGYVYTPLGLFCILPGYLLGDFRFSHVLALIGTAWFLATARPSKTAQLSATLFLLFPQTPFVLILSWTEPVALFWLGATLWCHFRAPKWNFFALGCLICAKQYTVFLLPLLPLLVPEKEKLWPLIAKSVAVALVLTLPMALWNWDGFFRSAVQMQFKQPFRPDSLSYLVAVLNATGRQLSPILGFVALLGGLFFGLRASKSASSWATTGAIAYLGFFAFNKQAFANYYFWVFGLLLAAVAVALPEESPHEKVR